MKKVIIDTIKQNKLYLLILVVFIALNMYLLTYPASILGKIFDLMSDVTTNKQEIINSTTYLLVICVALLFVRLIWKYVDTCIPRKFDKNVKDALFSHFLKLEISEIQERKNGEIMSYFVKDTNELRNACHHILSFGLRIIFAFIFAVYAMVAHVNLNLTLVCLSPILIAVVLMIYIKSKIHTKFKIARKKFTEFSEFVQESTDAIRTTKAYAIEDEQINKFTQKNNEVKKSNIEVNKYSNLLSVVTDFCFGLCYAISIFYGSNLILSGKISIGEFIAFNGYIALLLDPVYWIPVIVNRFKRAQVSYKRIDGVLRVEPEKIGETAMLNEASYDTSLSGDIVIKELNFSYPGYIDNVLKDISITIKKGETLGVIGNVGCGKTTLVNLLVRLYKVQRGQISINGKDINDIPIEVLRENISYITQDSFLFSTTIKENINLFRDDFDDSQIADSLENAAILEEIQNLPDGIHTVVGERGIDLSGGQKQRVTISRAFLNNSEIVIFDDTFSALDNRTEQKLLKNIRKLVKDKTCIIVSNRISDIKDADKIIVLNAGEIIEQGTHKELMKLGKSYYEYYKEQAVKTQDTILE